MVTFVLLVVRVVLAGVFGLAGIAKLADRAGTRQALSEFGIPPRLAGPGAVLLPAIELAVAGALLWPGSARLGALGSLVLLGLFSAAVATNLARGKQPDCHCFGQLHSAPIGTGTLRRNAALGGLGALILIGGPGGAPGFVSNMTGTERLLALGTAMVAGIAVLLGWAVVNLLRQHGRLLLRVDALEAMVGDHPGLPVGAVAPSFSLPSLSGGDLSLDALLAAGRPVLLIFADPYCGPCNRLLPEVGRWQRDYEGVVTIAVVSRGTPELNREKAAEHRLTDVLLQADREVARAYDTTATPSAVLIGEDQRIGSPVVAGGAAIRNLLLRAPNARTGAPRRPPEIHLDDQVEVLEGLNH